MSKRSSYPAGATSYYVVLTKKGRSETTIHCWIVAIVTLCLLIPPVSFLVDAGVHRSLFILMALGIALGAALLLPKNRKLAVASFMLTPAACVFVMANSIGFFTG